MFRYREHTADVMNNETETEKNCVETIVCLLKIILKYLACKRNTENDVFSLNTFKNNKETLWDTANKF